ncbi:MAG: hypothetical protein QOK15_1887 [Nocardioidaceae bacterium]|nr:hypothetical protein [Nocardioidaceae bacterium]
MSLQQQQQHLLIRTTLTAVATAVLIGGNATVALAHPGSHPGAGKPQDTAAHCKAERSDVHAAKKDLAHAHKTGKAADVDAAKDELKQQRKQASRWCSAAKSEAAVTARADAVIAGWTALTDDTTLTSLPTVLHDALVADAAAAEAEVQTLAPQVTGAGSSQLAHLAHQLRALDPTALQVALTDLDTALAAYTGDPTDLLGGVTGALGDLDVAGHPTHLQALVGAVREAAAEVAAANAAVPAP